MCSNLAAKAKEIVKVHHNTIRFKDSLIKKFAKAFQSVLQSILQSCYTTKLPLDFLHSKIMIHIYLIQYFDLLSYRNVIIFTELVIYQSTIENS